MNSLMKQFGVRQNELTEAELQSATTTLEALNAHTNHELGGELLLDPRFEDLTKAPIDPYIRGIVRTLNDAQLYTSSSCDGHNRGKASIQFRERLTADTRELLKDCAPPSISLQFSPSSLIITYPKGEQQLLLTYSEQLFNALFGERHARYKVERVKREILQWLNYSGASGNEREIKRHVEQKLDRYCDFTFRDRYQNVLGVIERGAGPTILLSAHLDIVTELHSERTIEQQGTVLSSSSGILGADDRAGIAAIFTVLHELPKTNFTGTIKVAFTVEEETGCHGARNLYRQFLDDVRGAIVLDRRGHRDIVTHCSDTIFCDDDYSQRFVRAGQLANMPDWRPVRGGWSDARIFAQWGIPSVNLSVGYENEHTAYETVDYYSTYETSQLVLSLLHNNLL